MTLDARVGCTLGALELGVALRAEAGETVAVLGPNGAGKSTLLRCLAGLLAIDRGHVTLDGHVLDDPAAGTFVAAERRSIGVVFQDYLLFAHLDARDNVAFGLRAHGARRPAARKRAELLLAQVGLGAVTRARPGALSGGQQQRVALARALAGDPRLLLLDEPLAALDVSTRAAVRRELRAHLRGFDGVRIIVTHDPLDAFALADRVLILEAGRVSQTGTVQDVAARPRSRYVADLVGTNLLRGVSDGTTFTSGLGATLVTAHAVQGEAFVVIPPTAVALYRVPPDGSPRNVWAGTVADIDDGPDRVRVRLGGPMPIVAEVTVGAHASMALRPGDPVWAVVKATEVMAYPT